MANLKKLDHLYIIDTRIVNITERVVPWFSTLTMLILSDNSLTLQKLQKLDLAYNRLSHLDGIPNVSFLDLSGNLFNQIPTMKYRDSLLSLYMDNNFLESTPSITSFINLEVLSLRNTNITFMPANIDKLRKLGIIDVAKNKIYYLPTTIINLPKLDYLDISNNSFSSTNIQAIRATFQKSRPEITLVI